MKKAFITFGDGGDNFIRARNRILREAKKTGQFDEMHGFCWNDITMPEVLASPLRKYKRGCGYWVWKPAIIYTALSQMNDGDILVYCDCGDVLFKAKRQWRYFFNVLMKRDIIFHRTSYGNIQYVRKELLEKFGSKSGIKGRLLFQYENNSFFIKKTPFTMGLIKSWLDFMIAYPELVRDVEGEKEHENQLPTFVENRHDQAVLTLLVEQCLGDNRFKDKIKTVWEFHTGWWLLGKPCIETARLRDDGKFRFGVKGMMKRVLCRLLWRLQLFLERKGFVLSWEKGGYYGA